MSIINSLVLVIRVGAFQRKYQGRTRWYIACGIVANLNKHVRRDIVKFLSRCSTDVRYYYSYLLIIIATTEQKETAHST